jgi:hypothetical protein
MILNWADQGDYKRVVQFGRNNNSVFIGADLAEMAAWAYSIYDYNPTPGNEDRAAALAWAAVRAVSPYSSAPDSEKGAAMRNLRNQLYPETAANWLRALQLKDMESY